MGWVRHELEMTTVDELHRVSCSCGWQRRSAFYTEAAARLTWEEVHLRFVDPAKHEALDRLRVKIAEEAP